MTNKRLDKLIEDQLLCSNLQNRPTSQLTILQLLKPRAQIFQFPLDQNRLTSLVRQTQLERETYMHNPSRCEVQRLFHVLQTARDIPNDIQPLQRHQ